MTESFLDRRRALEILGLPSDFDRVDVTSARRRAARRIHPDTGGTTEQMVLVNQAADYLLNSGSSVGTEDLGRRPDSAHRSDNDRDGIEVDRPSFVIDVLPVEAFWWILMAARTLGQVVDEDPPYVVELLIDHRPDRWCMLDIVPDAGSSTVSIITEGYDPAELVPLFVGAINELSNEAPFRGGVPPLS